jgi:membrane peptidoglycan carboxypeptidase
MANAPSGAPTGTPPAGPQPGTPAARRHARRSRNLKILAAALVLGLVMIAGVIGIGYATTDIPDEANAEFQTATSFVYYQNGKTELGTFAVQNREPLSFEEMPQSIKDAAVAAENRTFWTDQGISIRGMLRAAWVILRGGELQGGSTITQQYIKVMYLTQEQTLSRKFKELFIAYKLSNQRTKEEILEGYLNTIYFGRGAYGVQAASQAYFNIDAKKLTVPQAAVLASVVNNPSLFDPSVDEDNIPRLQERYEYVLSSMAETGAITPQQAADAMLSLPKFPKIRSNERYGGPKGFLLKLVERELAAKGFEASQISGGGLRITTTFDKNAQDAAVEAAQSNTKEAAQAAGKKAANLHAAIASVEVGTGRVLALYGGPDYVENSRNWATTARPTASTFKAYALAAGLKDGFSLRSRFNGNTFTPPGDSTPVRNEFSMQYGPVTLLRATAESINTAFVDLTATMSNGPKKVADMAVEAGVPKGKGWDLNSRIPLGATEVSPLNQANAFATFGNAGVAVEAHVVSEVTDADGNVLYKATPEEHRAVGKDIAADVTYALTDVVEAGTGRAVQALGRPVAGKTGTKDGVKDDVVSSWFVAYTKQISTAVMYVAGDSGNGDLDEYARPGDATFFGGTYPAMTWVDYMQEATKGMPVKEFDEPAFVNADTAPRQQEPSPTQQPQTREPTREPTEDETTPEPSEEPTTTEPTQTQPTRTAPTTAPTDGNPGNGSGDGAGAGAGDGAGAGAGDGAGAGAGDGAGAGTGDGAGAGTGDGQDAATGEGAAEGAGIDTGQNTRGSESTPDGG